jgi:hypothetical protein
VAANGSPEEKARVRTAVKKKYPHIDVGGAGSTTGENKDSDQSRMGQEPSMGQIFRPGQRVGKDSSAKPAPQQPMAKKRFKIGKE